jgi:hypothetical protein
MATVFTPQTDEYIKHFGYDEPKGLDGASNFSNREVFASPVHAYRDQFTITTTYSIPTGTLGAIVGTKFMMRCCIHYARVFVGIATNEPATAQLALWSEYPGDAAGPFTYITESIANTQVAGEATSGNYPQFDFPIAEAGYYLTVYMDTAGAAAALTTGSLGYNILYSPIL